MVAIVLGAGGMLGKDVCRHLGPDAIGLTRADCDICNPEHIAKLALGGHGRPKWIINAAAYTKVDLAETERQAAYEGNAMGPSYVASAAADLGARVIHVSTDFVFDGTKSVPYVESDAPHPLSVYGDTKLTGERNASPAVIVRTSWLFGADGPCFPKTMIRAHQAGKSLRVVADQFGTPTFTQELARVFGDIISNNLPDGIYHAAGPESMSWYEFAKRVLSSWAGTDVDVTPIRTEDWPTPAIRPKQSALSMDKLESLGIAKMEPLAKTLPTFCTTLRASESR